MKEENKGLIPNNEWKCINCDSQWFGSESDCGCSNPKVEKVIRRDDNHA